LSIRRDFAGHFFVETRVEGFRYERLLPAALSLLQDMQKPLYHLLAALCLATATPALADDPYVEGEVLVTFKSGVTATKAAGALKGRSLGMTQRFQRLSEKRQRVSALVREKKRSTAQLIEELKTDPAVETVEPNYLRFVSAVNNGDPGFPKLWGLQNTGQTVNSTTGTSGADTKFVQAWGMARPSQTEVVVAVIDTGVDIGHPDLAANIWTNSREIAGNGVDDDRNGRVDDMHGYDFASSSPAMSDSGEHGTHVAGTIAASGLNGTGIIGVQFKAKVLPLKVSTDGESLSTAAVLAAIDYTIDLKERGVNIVAVNASYGGSSSSTSERSAIEALRDAGIVMCAAAGNDGANNDTTASYPANYPTTNIISVAATTQTNQLANFSNYGATTVDIGAPGTNIYSAMPVALAPGTTTLKIGTSAYAAAPIDYSGSTSAGGLTKPMYACGVGQPSEFPAAVRGNIALIQRGTINFSDKVANAKTAGAVAAVIYDNSSGAITTNPWTLGAAGSWIPAIRISQADGQAIAASSLPVGATVIASLNTAAAYQFMDGTSMAAPHVAGAVAFAALNFPGESVTQRIARILNNVTPVSALSGKVAKGGTLNLLKMTDTDGDSLPDWWEGDYFGNLLQTSSGDVDRDGFTNLEEYLSGTLPGSNSSKLALSAVPSGGTQTFTMSFPSVADRTYRVQWSSDLKTWTQLGSLLSGTGSPIKVTDAIVRGSKRFYRLQIVVP
jgi:subtilisin family serine protease